MINDNCSYVFLSSNTFVFRWRKKLAWALKKSAFTDRHLSNYCLTNQSTVPGVYVVAFKLKIDWLKYYSKNNSVLRTSWNNYFSSLTWSILDFSFKRLSARPARWLWMTSQVMYDDYVRCSHQEHPSFADYFFVFCLEPCWKDDISQSVVTQAYRVGYS